ncbi:hypothetical protein JOF53_002885 [Crossiella equi]|uniref:4Fe-4S Wbl-type domain-containing protein n=1 Tax=Crossiella equi TaxID=130796 RepID=A0ABS5ABQ8_9PSEU|nr:WhiB family transcriptional regulator [Crossiella equi]MBP2474013.1 hypothetical protein [Crossiella equi]
MSNPTDHPGYQGHRLLLMALFGPSMRRPEWQAEAACADEDPATFFTRNTTMAALAVCAGCPVRQECRAEQLEWEGRYSTARRYPDGVAGGMTPIHRREHHEATRSGTEAA